jgi:FixJ family two-component response regulator
MRRNVTKCEEGGLVVTKEQLNDEIELVTHEAMRLKGPKKDVDTMEAFKNSRIIIVDDDLLVCETLTELVRNWGLCAEGFTQPKAALKHIEDNGCDIVLLDVFISDVSGLDLIPQISNEESDDLKIIIITGFADKDTAIRALQLGAFDLLVKPFQNELLYHSILRALKSLANEKGFRKLIDDLKQSRSVLLGQQKRLENLNAQLRDTNKALSIFAQNIERERGDVEKRSAVKLRNLVMPMVQRLRNDKVLSRYEGQLDMLTMVRHEGAERSSSTDSLTAAMLHKR